MGCILLGFAESERTVSTTEATPVAVGSISMNQITRVDVKIGESLARECEDWVEGVYPVECH
jgi:hypothetical protein